MSAYEISGSLKLVGRGDRCDTVVDVNGVEIGGQRIVVIAGPCSVESRMQILEAARAVKKGGAHMLRGGAFKPRTSPYSFQGLEEEGLKLLTEAREETGLPVVTEVLSPMDVELVSKYVDMLQIGTRNMQNYPLLRAVGRTERPVLLKRGLGATVNEWLNAAEYIMVGGNEDVILCERGIRSLDRITRFTLDLAVVPLVKKVSHLPVIVDPSHATGIRELVSPMARASVAAGADGVIVEVHPNPQEALSDGAQSLLPVEFTRLMEDLKAVTLAVGKII
jgi:3-deoxy-7-phosphoheptulonate synthase